MIKQFAATFCALIFMGAMVNLTIHHAWFSGIVAAFFCYLLIRVLVSITIDELKAEGIMIMNLRALHKPDNEDFLR